MNLCARSGDHDSPVLREYRAVHESHQAQQVAVLLQLIRLNHPAEQPGTRKERMIHSTNTFTRCATPMPAWGLVRVLPSLCCWCALVGWLSALECAFWDFLLLFALLHLFPLLRLFVTTDHTMHHNPHLPLTASARQPVPSRNFRYHPRTHTRILLSKC